MTLTPPTMPKSPLQLLDDEDLTDWLSAVNTVRDLEQRRAVSEYRTLPAQVQADMRIAVTLSDADLHTAVRAAQLDNDDLQAVIRLARWTVAS